jgi:hypothetical protein
MSRRMRFAGHVARMTENGNACRLVRPEGKRPVGRPGLSLVYNIKVDRGEIAKGGVD